MGVPSCQDWRDTQSLGELNLYFSLLSDNVHIGLLYPPKGRYNRMLRKERLSFYNFCKQPNTVAPSFFIFVDLDTTYCERNLLSRDSNVSLLPLLQLISRCRQESELFRQQIASNTSYCFELFYRAIVDKNSAAWEAVYQQYRSITASWVTRCPTFPMVDESVDFFVNRAFEKFWIAVTSEKFALFPNLASVLRYLKMCVFSVVSDFARLKEVVAANDFVDSENVLLKIGTGDVEGEIFERTYLKQLWELVQARLQSEREYKVMYATYLLGLKPRQVKDLYPELFNHAGDVSRIKENVIARLRRDRLLKSILRDA